MSSYDPRRSRPTPKVAPDEESAPIDALLGPGPDPEPGAAGGAEPAPAPVVPAAAEPDPEPSPAPDAPAPEAVPVRKVERAPSALVQLSPLLVATLLALVFGWLVRRRRR